MSKKLHTPEGHAVDKAFALGVTELTSDRVEVPAIVRTESSAPAYNQAAMRAIFGAEVYDQFEAKRPALMGRLKAICDRSQNR